MKQPEQVGVPAHASDPVRAQGRAGFRLDRLEVFNWGTFHKQVWSLHPRSDNALLTGDIGSGKSTLVDAITTLLVPPHKLAYNKAADAGKDERSLRTYVLGHYKRERPDKEQTAKPVALRDHNAFSVILARFSNEGFGRHVTLAQVFYWKSPNTNTRPETLFLVSEKALSITEHFASFGNDIKGLRKRLQKYGKVEDSFSPYATTFRNNFGIDNPQALDLFHQAVSMKSVGNLTDFVRLHMLEPFDVEERIEKLIDHFNDLTRAHEAVLKAKDQIARLRPIVESYQRMKEVHAKAEHLRGCRDALRGWYAEQKRDLLAKRLAIIAQDLERIELRLQALDVQRTNAHAERDDVKKAIDENGGNRLDQLKQKIEQLARERDASRDRAKQYERLAGTLGLPPPSDADVFIANSHALVKIREEGEVKAAELRNAHTDKTVEFRRLHDKHAEVETELKSLRQRRSNIPAHMLTLRGRMCRELQLDEAALPFAGELIQVHADAKEWEGAAERLLHSLGLTVLVADEHYRTVAEWVDATDLRGKLVYYHVREPRSPSRAPSPGTKSILRKLSVKPGTRFYRWLDADLSRRFDYVCCDGLDDLNREPFGITRAGQIKQGNERHEKDDRYSIHDRTRYVLGWSNEAKIAALDAECIKLAAAGQEHVKQLGVIGKQQTEVNHRLRAAEQLGMLARFSDLDWRPLEAEMLRLAEELRRLEATSDVLAELRKRLDAIESLIDKTGKERDEQQGLRGKALDRQEAAQQQERDCAKLVEGVTLAARTLYADLEVMRGEALPEHQLTVESCDNREKDYREWLHGKISNEEKTIGRLRESIVQQMQAYSNQYPAETREVDVSVESAAEYERMLERLSKDDLPRFEKDFKKLLNENTIREVATFQGQLKREVETIKERIEIINESLRAIDYNQGRYITLEAVEETDKEVRQFREDLKACTAGTLTGSEEETYSEAKFLQVKAIIERFRESTEIDRKWTRRVTDVRNWFTFAASERWRADDSVHEHYADSGGKSGGQKEKLAYTVLAASLAYQFGLEWGVKQSRSFRFVVIDEAFGRGSDESAQYGLELFKKLNLQLLIATPLQKIHIIEPYVDAVGFVHNEGGRLSMVRNLTIEEYRAERDAHDAAKR